MRPLRYSINVTLDGCCDHCEMFADEDLHRHAVENLDQADALLFGRVTYEMMEAAWRPPARTGARPDWMEPFARTIDVAKKYVLSSTLDRVDWNAERVRGDLLGTAVQQLKRESGKGLFVGGVKLPLALAELGLIDEYEFVVNPRLAGHGPTLFAGLSKRIDLRLVSRTGHPGFRQGGVQQQVRRLAVCSSFASTTFRCFLPDQRFSKAIPWKIVEKRTLKPGSSPPPSRVENLAGHKRPLLQSISQPTKFNFRHKIWHLALRIGTVKKSPNFIRVDGPACSMRIGAAK